MTKSQTDQIAAKTNSRAHEVIDDDGHSGRNNTSPFVFPLHHVAESIPGGVETMVTLASLCCDKRVRDVASRWTSLSRKAKQTAEFEQLCRDVGIDGGHFFSAITTTAFELGMDVSGFIGSLACWTVQAPTFSQQAAKDTAMREQFFKAAAFWAGTTPEPACEPISLARALGRRGMSKRIDRGHRVLSREGRRSCNRMAAFRRKVGLSQGQFAQLFTTSARTVRRWESHKFTPTPHQQWFLGILVRYAKQNGITAFRNRFVGEPARFARPGRPPNVARDRFPSNYFDRSEPERRLL